MTRRPVNPATAPRVRRSLREPDTTSPEAIAHRNAIRDYAEPLLRMEKEHTDRDTMIARVFEAKGWTRRFRTTGTMGISAAGTPIMAYLFTHPEDGVMSWTPLLRPEDFANFTGTSNTFRDVLHWAPSEVLWVHEYGIGGGLHPSRVGHRHLAVALHDTLSEADRRDVAFMRALADDSGAPMRTMAYLFDRVAEEQRRFGIRTIARQHPQD